MSVRELFGTNKNEEVDGIIVDYTHFKVKICRAGGSNKRYYKVLEKNKRKYKTLIRNNALTADMNDEIIRNTFAECIVMEWWDVMESDLRDSSDDKGSDDDKQAECVKENIYLLLKNIPDFFSSITEDASGMKLWKSTDEEDSKNSLTS